MNTITIKAVRSDILYKKIMEAPIEKRDDIYRFEFMQPFEKKWAMYHCPLKAKQPNGYDVVMASSMLGYLSPQKIDASLKDKINLKVLIPLCVTIVVVMAGYRDISLVLLCHQNIP